MDIVIKLPVIIEFVFIFPLTSSASDGVITPIPNLSPFTVTVVEPFITKSILSLTDPMFIWSLFNPFITPLFNTPER